MRLLLFLQVLKKPKSAPLKTAIPGLTQIMINKKISYIKTSNSSPDSPPQCENSRLNIDTRETTNQGKTNKEGFKVWKGKGKRNEIIPSQSVYISNKFDILAEAEESSVSQINESEVEIEKQDNKLKNRRRKKNLKKIKNRKRSEKTMKENNEVDALLMFVEELMVLETSTHQFKKCKICKYCKKCCKLRGNCHTGRKVSTERKTADVTEDELSLNILDLIKERIDYLEYYEDLQT